MIHTKTFGNHLSRFVILEYSFVQEYFLLKGDSTYKSICTTDRSKISTEEGLMTLHPQRKNYRQMKAEKGGRVSFLQKCEAHGELSMFQAMALIYWVQGWALYPVSLVFPSLFLLPGHHEASGYALCNGVLWLRAVVPANRLKPCTKITMSYYGVFPEYVIAETE